jgi:hypothetical protein
MSTSLDSLLTLGVAPLTLLASAGGVAAASKRPFLLSGSAAVLALVSSFGEGGAIKKKIRQTTMAVFAARYRLIILA